MSIATDITGNSGGSVTQLMELLSNPDAYASKLKTMENATAEYKKYVEAVGVVTEILTLRDKAAQLRADAEAYRNDAASKADAMLVKAKADADALVSGAKGEADAISDKAQKDKQMADSLLAEAQKTKQQADSALKKATSAQASADAKAQAAQAAQDKADAELANAQALKAEIIAKHKEFIESL